jgi:hypothetical protein
MQKRKRGSKMECFKNQDPHAPLKLNLASISEMVDKDAGSLSRTSAESLSIILSPKGFWSPTLSFLVWEWDFRSGSEVGTLYIKIKLEKDEASKSVKSLYFNGKLTCIWTGAQQKLVDRYKRYGDLSNTWEPKVKTIFFYAKACNHVAFRASHSLR